MTGALVALIDKDVECASDAELLVDGWCYTLVTIDLLREAKTTTSQGPATAHSSLLRLALIYTKRSELSRLILLSNNSNTNNNNNKNVANFDENESTYEFAWLASSHWLSLVDNYKVIVV